MKDIILDEISDGFLTVKITDDFSPAKIAESGQCFRWSRVSENEYRIIHAGKCIYLNRIGEAEYCIDCSADEFYNIWALYFDLGENYSQIRARIDPRRDAFLYQAAEEQKGLRILRQDPWETLISFIISQNKNIPAIKKSIELLCRSAGEGRTDARGARYYAFPTPDALSAMDENNLKACKVGYRWKYIQSAANAVLYGDIDLTALICADEGRTMKILIELYGVGLKVASCVSLYGLHHTDAFPIDIWMKRILADKYPEGYPYERYSPYNGLCQQYLFASYRGRFAQAR